MLTTRHRHAQSGVLLLEVLIALLIFALGVLGLVGLQANAIKQSSQAKYRADATLLANDLIGQMWLAGRDFGVLYNGFRSDSGGGANYQAWLTKVQDRLPGSDANPPTVTVTQIMPLDAIVSGASAPSTGLGLGSSTRVTITMRWKAPGEAASDPVHNVVLTNEIK